MENMVTSSKRREYSKKSYYKDIEKSRARQNAWWKANPTKRRQNKLKYRYGIGLEEYQDMFTAQNGTCAICGSAESLNVDHDHMTGKVRGLLCRACNHGLGNFQDSTARLVAAIRYLTGPT